MEITKLTESQYVWWIFD